MTGCGITTTCLSRFIDKSTLNARFICGDLLHSQCPNLCMHVATLVGTSILLAEAVGENLADFNDSVSKHLSELNFTKGSPFHTITLSELATHTSVLLRLPMHFSGEKPLREQAVEMYLSRECAGLHTQRLLHALDTVQKNRLRQSVQPLSS